MTEYFYWPIDGTLTGITSLSDSGPGSNGNKGGCYIPPILHLGASLSDEVSVILHTLVVRMSEVQSVYSTSLANKIDIFCFDDLHWPEITSEVNHELSIFEHNIKLVPWGFSFGHISQINITV